MRCSVAHALHFNLVSSPTLQIRVDVVIAFSDAPAILKTAAALRDINGSIATSKVGFLGCVGCVICWPFWLCGSLASWTCVPWYSIQPSLSSFLPPLCSFCTPRVLDSRSSSLQQPRTSQRGMAVPQRRVLHAPPPPQPLAQHRPPQLPPTLQATQSLTHAQTLQAKRRQAAAAPPPPAGAAGVVVMRAVMERAASNGVVRTVAAANHTAMQR